MNHPLAVATYESEEFCHPIPFISTQDWEPRSGFRQLVTQDWRPANFQPMDDLRGEAAPAARTSIEKKVILTLARVTPASAPTSEERRRRAAERILSWMAAEDDSDARVLAEMRAHLSLNPVEF